MKLNTLELVNFRSHAKTVLEFDHWNFVIGPNGSGKSSIANAISWLFTGIVDDVTDAGGKGSDDLVRAGMESCKVTASITVDGKTFELERSKEFGRGNGVLTARAGKNVLVGPPAKEWMAKNLPSAQIFQAVFSASNFVNLDQASQKRLLASVLADEGIPVPKELHEALGSEPLTIAALDRAHKEAYDARTVLNRDMKQLASIEAPASADPPNVDDIKKRLAAITKERDGVVAARAHMLNGAKSHAGERKILEDAIAKHVPLPMAEEKRLKGIAQRVNKESATRPAVIAADIDRLRVANMKLESVGTKECPTCGHSLTKSEIVSILKSRDQEIERLREELEKATAEENAYTKAVEETRKAKEAIQASIGAAFQREQLDAELKALPGDMEAPDVSELDEQIRTFDSRIAKGQDVLAQASAMAERIQNYQWAMKKRTEIEASLKQLEAILAFAGPDGARKAATGDKLAPFVESLNAALQHFDFQATLTLEPFLMLVSEHDGVKFQIHQLSESEKFRFGTAFQIALAQVTSLNLVVIDFADMLEKKNRRALTAMLMSSGIEQAIVCSTSDEAPPANPPEGVRFYRLDLSDEEITRIAMVQNA